MYAYFDPLGNAVHTALSVDVLGEDVLITGAGPIGMAAVAIARHAGARHVVITDVNDYRLEIAKKLGASLAINVSKTSIADTQKELGREEGFDVGLEMSGNPQALNDMLTNMCHGGKIALLGIQAPGTIIDWDDVVFKGLVVKGIYGREMYETWYKLTMMILSGMDITTIATHSFDYREFEQGVDVLASGDAGKVILEWEEAAGGRRPQ